jgi:DNA-binding NtrC family response regulator
MTFESLSPEEHELAIPLDDAASPAREETFDRGSTTTEVGLLRPDSIEWARVLEECTARLVSRWKPDVAGAMEHLASITNGRAVAFLTRTRAGDIIVQAASGNIADLSPWIRSEAIEEIVPADARHDSITVHHLDQDRALAIAVSWGGTSWEAALILAGNRIGSAELPFLEVALRLFQSATVPVPEDDRSLVPSESDLVFPDWHVVGRTPAMRTLYRQLATLIGGTIPVLVTGETGVGKEHVVRILHASSDRARGPLQIVNCTAIPADLLEAELFGIEAGVATGVTRRTGKLRLAHGGMLFLDEIGDMDPALQAKLLRALQEGEVHPLGAAAPITVNVRVIAATNTNLEQRVRDGHFRKDLYYRIAGCEVHVPALRHRIEDIPALAQYFLQRAAAENHKKVRGLSVSAMDALQRAAWPGNVRQLQRELTRLVVSCPESGTIESRMISPSILTEKIAGDAGGETDDLDLKQQLAAVEKNLIERALERAEGNHSEAARILGVTRNGLTMKMKRLGIEKPS